MRKIIVWSFIFSIVLGMFACRSVSKRSNFKEINGYWKSIGYGRLLDINDSVVAFYDTYQGGCVFNSEAPTEFLIDGYIKRVAHDTLILKSGSTAYDFIRTTEKGNCNKATILTADPLNNFDALWQTFQENYCSFELRQVNWNVLRDKYRVRLNANSTQKELSVVLSEMLSELNDGHVSLEVPDDLKNELAFKDEGDDSLRQVAIKKINSKYLAAVDSYNYGVINSGLINDSVAYVQINDFETLANYKINPSLSREKFNESYQKEAEESSNLTKDVRSGISTKMNSLFNSIKRTRHCIIDLRFNGGGLDEAGTEVLRHFIQTPQKVYSKKAKYLNGFTPEQTVILSPSKIHYPGKIYILTSHETASAAEVFLLASLNIKTIRIGSTTEGIFSDVLSKRLPNGWEYELSNEIYLSTDGENYEKTGISPDYEIKYSVNQVGFYLGLIKDLKEGDKAIEKALALTRHEQ